MAPPFARDESIEPAAYRPASAPSQPPQTAPSPVAPPKRGFSTATVVGVAAASAIIGGLLAGAVVATVVERDDAASAVSPGGDVARLTVEQTSAVADAAAKARPSVVRIESTVSGQGGQEIDIGSGVVLDNQGHIITNAHVVLNTDAVKVILPNGEERAALLVGHDYPFTDIAVLQVGPGGLTPIETGDSESLAAGQSVIAIGNPLGDLDGSITVGVIGGVDRVRTFDAVRSADLIQTDAAINSGNSGGALVNLAGQFIGMPTSVIRESNNAASVEGIAFALPSNRVLDIARRIIEGGGIERPDLGVDYLDLDDEVLKRVRSLQVDEGAVVLTPLPGGPAAMANVAAGDVITSIAGTPVDRSTPLLNALMDQTPGETVKVVLNRQGQIIEADVRLGTR